MLKVEKNRNEVVTFTYTVNGLDERTVTLLVSLILNSTRESLNKYLESRGGISDIISDDDMKALVDLANNLHKSSYW